MVFIQEIRFFSKIICSKNIFFLFIGLFLISQHSFAYAHEVHTAVHKAHTNTINKKRTHAGSTIRINHHRKTKLKLLHKKKMQKKRKAVTHVKEKEVLPPSHFSINRTNLSNSRLPAYLLTSLQKTLVDVVKSTIATLRYTAYKLGGTRIDTSRGIYIVDCSSYVDHVLKTVYPHAFTKLTSYSGTQKPTTYDYYNYFKNLTGDRHSLWHSINHVEQLRPGDIIVFRLKNKYGYERGGHVMIVMDKPIRQKDEFLIRVSDSASKGHSTDTRSPDKSGIGIGSMLLKADSKTSLPYAYAWKIGSHWEKNVKFAMARPYDQS